MFLQKAVNGQEAVTGGTLYLCVKHQKIKKARLTSEEVIGARLYSDACCLRMQVIVH